MPFYNFGLEPYLRYVLYAAAVAVLLWTIFRRPVTGVYFLVPLLPLQTIRYRLNGLPLGESLAYVMLLAIGIGLLRQGRSFVPKTPWTVLLCVYGIFSFVSLWAGSVFLDSPYPLPGDQRFKDWLAYMTMPAIFFAVAASVDNIKEIKTLLALMCGAILLLDRSFWNSVSGRDYSSYSETLRQELSSGGAMGYAGINGLAAFEAQAATFLLAMAAFEKRWFLRLGYLGLALYSALCLMYSFSRAGYVAFLAGWIFLGLVKERKLLLLLGVFVLAWTSVVPNAVVERVQMTKDQDGNIDHSSQLRVELWEDALEIVPERLWLGSGFNTYAYMGRSERYNDTHNYYLKLLVETGVAGLLLFLWLLGKSFFRGVRLFRRSGDPVLRGVGLGLAGWVVCAAASNFFGDRWNYLQIQGYFWALAGLVARGQMLCDEAAEASEGDAAEPAEGQEAGQSLPAADPVYSCHVPAEFDSSTVVERA